MNQQFDFFSQSVNLFRDLSNALLSSSEQLMSLQLDGAQSCVTRGSDQLRSVCSDLTTIQQSKLSSDTVQVSMRNAIAMTRDNVLATSDHQLETLRQLQRQGAELQKVITDSFDQHLANVERERLHGEQSVRVNSLSPKQAA